MQAIDNSDARVCTISLVLTHQAIKVSAQGRTWPARYYRQVQVEQGSEVEHGINSRSQDTSVSIHRIYPAATIIQENSLGFAPAIEALLPKSIKDDDTATHFPTGPALLVSFIRHHKAAKGRHRHPFCYS
jgi:hypothetical protein